MVIISANANVEGSTQPPLQSTSEPPIPERLEAATYLTSDRTKSAICETPHRELNAANEKVTSWEDACVKAHVYDIDYISGTLNVDVNHGISVSEASCRLERLGPNVVEDTERVSMWQIFLRQVCNSLTIVLLITMILSFSLEDYIEGTVITAVIGLNIVVGFVQDYRAEKTILSLQAMSAPTCKVLRAGEVQVVKAEYLVVGDIVHLAVGDVVPADLRLFDGMNISTDEALLTGESLPVQKAPHTVFFDAKTPIGDRLNMAYSASTVTQGRAQGLVVATAMNTEVGKIAGLLRYQNGPPASQRILFRVWKSFIKGAKHALGLVGSPLQVRLSKFALLLFGLATLLAIIVFSASTWHIEDEVLIYGICVAVAVIPESLIAVLTLTIAVGTKAMAKSNIIVRKMSSLEAVGGVTNICSDKTGTLTQGKMIARKAIIPDVGIFSVHDTTNPFDPTSGKIEMECLEDSRDSIEDRPSLVRFLNILALCNLSTVRNLDKSASESSSSLTISPGNWIAVGEPTEIALQVLAMRFGNGKSELLASGNRRLLEEFPFDSAVKRMTMMYSRTSDDCFDVFTKGATESILPILCCSEEKRRCISDAAESMAADGLRVLCLAHKILPAASRPEISQRSSVEKRLTFAGLVGLHDPPRQETAEAVRKCQQAGITVHMLTGDHIRTAITIAAEVGIIKPIAGLPDGVAMPASQFDSMSEEDINGLETLPLVIARCSPTTKVRMIDALRRRGAFSVMTGDGVNDSPALKRADVGIAMGRNGSDVAKQAADMVLVDDDFASIVRAVEEGRRLFDNIQKFLLHLLTSNIAQVVLLLTGLAFKDRGGSSVFPLSPIEILWVNLVTSSPLAIGLGLEKAAPDIMCRPPHSLRVGVFTKELIIDKMVYGVTMGALCLVGFVAVVYGDGNSRLGQDCNQDFNSSCNIVFRARATVFAILTFTLLVTAWEVKDFNRSLFNMMPRDSLDRHATERGRQLKQTPTAFSFFPTVYQNKFLFWSFVAGFVLAFPIIYVPAVNKTVFKHSPITFEWGVVFGCLAIYVAVIEAWKATKRGRSRRGGRKVGGVLGHGVGNGDWNEEAV